MSCILIKPYPIFRCVLYIFAIFIGIPLTYSQTVVKKNSDSSLNQQKGDTSLPKFDTLKPVIVTPRIPYMHIKGDTLEYNTANIRLKVNATVEELLRQLPGVQIDQNGNITVNGQKIQRLLVDGEDVLAGGPTLITRNFNADMIAKVQVLDKKNKEAEFTGIDDGKRTKTLNLTLKEDSKKGYFGKAETGAGTDYYNCNAMLGSFKDRRQLFVLGMIANTGNSGFNGNVDGMGSGLSLAGSTDDGMGSSAGGGIPRVEGGGVHYADTWGSIENHFSGNYQYGNVVTHPFSSSINRQTLPDSIYIQNQKSSSVNGFDQHALSTEFDLIPDTISAFRISIGGQALQGKNEFVNSGSSYYNDTLVNNSFRSINSDVQNKNIQGNIMYRITGRRNKQRILSMLTSIVKQDNLTNGYLYSNSNFFNPSTVLLSSDTIDERKTILDNKIFFLGSLNYVSPLSKDVFLGIGYGFSLDQDQSKLGIFNKGDGKYQSLIDSLSNHYQTNILSQRGSLSLQSGKGRLTYSLGASLEFFNFRQKDLLKDSVLIKKYSVFSPRINLRYSILNDKNISFDYSGGAQQPPSTALKTVQNNNDPLHVYLGNPDLRPSHTHIIGIHFTMIKPIILDASAIFGLITNSFSTKTFTDSLGRQVSQTVNIGTATSGGPNLSVSKNLAKINLILGINANCYFSQNYNYINLLLNRNNNFSTEGGFSIARYVADKYSFRISTNFTYSSSHSSINTTASTNYWTQSHSAEVSFFPSPGLELINNCNFIWLQKTSYFLNDNETILWNASVSKNLFRNRLNINCQINDILGQNKGISRSNIGNQLSENVTNTIGRYWLLSLTYHFKKNKN